ncbi:unnamed protein product, partial [Polarella glacialis]
MRRVASLWLDRFAEDRHAALAELVSLVMVVADVPSQTIVMKEDLQECEEPVDVVQNLTAALALEASEKGADFTQHWLVAREKGALRVRENYPAIWRELVVAPPAGALLAGLLELLRAWTLALSECQFRSIRHAAVVAGLSLVEGLGVQCRSLRDFCSAAAVQIRDAEAQHEAGPRLASLGAELQSASRCAQELATARDSLGAALLSRRTKDVDPEVRRSCFDSLGRWAEVDAQACLDPLWTRYLQFGLNDRDSKARSAALAALQELFRGDPASVPAAVTALADRVRPRVLARCHDADASVGAAAVRCTVALAARGLLAEDDFDPVIDLVWDSDPQRRGEAAAFVSRFVFNEDILDYPGGQASCAIAQRRLLMLLQFVGEYSDGHLELVERLVAALWRRASCLEDWEAIAALALPLGGSQVPLSGELHGALIHLAEATCRLAAEDAAATNLPQGASHAEAVLDRAARALAPRLPALLVACQAEPKVMRRATALCSNLLRHCALRSGCGGGCDGLVAGAPGEAAAEALKAGFLRQPDSEAQEHIALALAHLLDLCAGARPLVRDLAASLKARFLQLAPLLSPQGPATISVDGAAEVPPEDAILATVVRLRILAKAFDVSLCDLEGFGATALCLLEDRATASDESMVRVTPQLSVALLELMVLVLTRHAAAVLQPEPLARCVFHDPIDQNQLRHAPTAAEDLLSLCSALLVQDPCKQVRIAALAASTALVTAWWNGAHLAAAAASGEAPSHWVPAVNEELSLALCGHLGELLTEANSVPPDCGRFPTGGAPEPGSSRTTSAFSLLFSVLQASLAPAAAAAARGEDSATHLLLSDSDRVRLASLTCAMLASCRHHQVAAGPLPALILSQALSPREDLQEAAWMLLRRLRKEAHLSPENAEAFFSTHVGVGKLSPCLQAALLSSLRAGVDAAVGEGVREGLLEALTPWVTKHVVEDDYLRELATWAGSLAGGEAAEAYQRAGLAGFVEACRLTSQRGGGGATRPAGGGGHPGAADERNDGASPAPEPPAREEATTSKRRRTSRAAELRASSAR